MTADEQCNADAELLSKVARQLGERFDCVQIFANRHEGGTMDGTMTVQFGCGNWYARYGQVLEWVEVQAENARVKARKEQ